MLTKNGSIPWVVNIPFKNDTMVIGYDVYHEKEGDMRQPSFGALVRHFFHQKVVLYTIYVMETIPPLTLCSNL